MPEHLGLYLDQCMRLEVAEADRDNGHDVLRASDVDQARADDSEILQRAWSERRILVTLDEHFGNWAVLPLTEHFGVRVSSQESYFDVRPLLSFGSCARGQELPMSDVDVGILLDMLVDPDECDVLFSPQTAESL